MKRFKWILIFVIYFGMLGNGLAGNLDDKSNWVLTSVHDEMCECSTFYGLVGELVRKSGEGKLAEQYSQLTTQMNQMISKIGETVNITPEATLAKMKLLYEMHMDTISNNSNNLPILFVKYGDFCKQVVENSDSRFNFYMSEYKRKFEN